MQRDAERKEFQEKVLKVFYETGKKLNFETIFRPFTDKLKSTFPAEIELVFSGNSKGFFKRAITFDWVELNKPDGQDFKVSLNEIVFWTFSRNFNNHEAALLASWIGNTIKDYRLSKNEEEAQQEAILPEQLNQKINTLSSLVTDFINTFQEEITKLEVRIKNLEDTRERLEEMRKKCEVDVLQKAIQENERLKKELNWKNNDIIVFRNTLCKLLNEEFKETTK